MKTVSVIGNRPQLMKLIPELADVVIWTGQHYSQVLRGAYTKQLDKCNTVIDLEQTTLEGMIDSIRDSLEGTPLVTVYGDTDSTLAGAIAAKKAGCDLVHIESGLRSGNMSMPEERNRIIVDSLSDYKFSIAEYGDIMQERLYEFWIDEMNRQKPWNLSEKWICTIHRAENSGEDIMRGIVKNICTYTKRPRIYLHPKAEQFFSERERVLLPAFESAVTYYLLMKELWNCEGVITDSGGLMREAVWLEKPCIVLRDECEFPELVEAGHIKLVGRSEAKLRKALDSRDWGRRRGFNEKFVLENPNTTNRILDSLGIERRTYAEHKEDVVCNASV